MPASAVSSLRSAYRLEAATLTWNVVGTVVLVLAAAGASSVALLGFALDSLLEIAASSIVIWELAAGDQRRQARALRLLGLAFAVLAAYLLVQSVTALAASHRPGSSALGIVWTALTAAAMFSLAWAKHRVGTALANPVVIAEGRVTLVDALLASAVVIGLALNAAAGLWWADTAIGLVIAFYAAREARTLLAGHA